MSQMKVMVFIDGSNLFWALKRLNEKIDYEKLLNVLLNGRILIRAYYFCSVPPKPSSKQLSFLRALEYRGFQVVRKTLKIRLEEPAEIRNVEKGVDVALVTAMLSMAFKNAYDVAVLVSGDDDFREAVEEIKGLGKRVEIAAFSYDPYAKTSLVSDELKRTADKFISLENVSAQISRTDDKNG